MSSTAGWLLARSEPVCERFTERHPYRAIACGRVPDQISLALLEFELEGLTWRVGVSLFWCYFVPLSDQFAVALAWGTIHESPSVAV